MTTKTPEQVFKDYAAQVVIAREITDDAYFTGDVEAALTFLGEFEDVVPIVMQSEPFVMLETECGSYWGNGPTQEAATRYLIGAILTSGGDA